jgi:ferredoxin-NADP reductase
MAEQLLERGAPLLVLYGSRDEKSIIFRERLDALARAYPRLTVRHVLSDPSSSWTGDRGWIDGPLVLRAAPPREGREFYLCGPAELVDSVREALVAGGVPDACIHQERFLPGSSGAARRASRGALVRFRRTGREVRVLPGQSILEAGLRAGLSLPYGCAAGQCRECAARLASGHLSMEETSPLTSAERENGVVLTCISYPDGDCELDL